MSDHSFEPAEFDRHKANLGSIGEVVNSTIDAAQNVPNPLMYGLIAGPILMPVMSIASQAAGQYVGGLGSAFENVQGQIDATKAAYVGTETTAVSGTTGMAT